MADAQDLLEVQRRVSALLRGEDPASEEPRLREAAQLLSHTLQDIVADDPFWQDVSRDVAEASRSAELGAVFAIDWTTVFREYGYTEEEAQTAAADLVGVAASALSSADVGAWEGLRSRLLTLSKELADDATSQRTAKDRSWVTRLRARVGFGLGVVRRISLRKLATEVVKAGAQHAMAAGVAILLGGGPFTVPALVGALAARLTIALVEESRRGWKEQREETESARLRDFYRTSAMLDFGKLGSAISTQKLTSGLALIALSPDASDQASTQTNFGESAVLVRRWLATAGLDLANAWSFVISYAGKRGAQAMIGLFHALDSARSALSRLEVAVEDGFLPGARTAAEDLQYSFDRIEEGVRRLIGELFASGALSKH